MKRNLSEPLFFQRKRQNDLFDYIEKILGSKNLKEFNYIDIIRNIIEQINNIDKYIFIGKLSDLSKLDKENIKKEKLIKFILNDVIRKKFKFFTVLNVI